IKMVQLKMIIERELAVSLELELLLDGASIRDVARSIVRQIREGQEMAVLLIRRADRSARLPLSFAQQRLWLLAQSKPAIVVYNKVGALRLIGTLDVSALERSLREIVRRHEVLRTSFRLEDGEPWQEISGQWEIDLPVRNLADLTGDQRIQAAQRLVAQ